jgi:tetratricopeptide (TPR) repeat protein
MLRSCGLSVIGVLGLGISLAYGQVGSALSKDSQWEQGKNYLAEGKAAEAKEIFSALLNKYPEDPDLYLFLGIAFLRLRDPRAAEAQIKKALALAPNHAEARTLLGWIDLEVKRDYSSAVDEYARVIALRPDFPEAYNNLGVALRKKGDLDKALENFNQALKLRQDYSEARSNRGWVYVEQRKWREARADFEQALRVNPQDDGALYGLSHVLKEARDYAGAQRALSQLMTQSPNFVYWLEWGQIQLVRYYWVLLLIAGALFLQSRYKKVRRDSHGS